LTPSKSKQSAHMASRFGVASAIARCSLCLGHVLSSSASRRHCRNRISLFQSSSSSSSSNIILGNAEPYEPPKWIFEGDAVLEAVPPHGRCRLANLPTPLYQIFPPSGATELNKGQTQQQNFLSLACPALSELELQFFVKRDDSSAGVELGGNKIRKLEFLLADALANDCDSVITIGGEQSNHCRATAAASVMLGMEPHLILRTKKASYDPAKNELGTVGNLLFDRMVGSQVYTCTPGEYGRIGSDALVARLANHLQSLGRNPYSIPVGGSNGLGSWGYVNGVDELVRQWESAFGQDAPSLDHIVLACGSGGTAAGITLGIAMAYAKRARNSQGKAPIVHAIGVCDDPDYFYAYVAKIADEMGFKTSGEPSTTEEFVRQHMTVHQGKGLGYAISTQEELEFVTNFARGTGIVLDPVYSGKALYQFVNSVIAETPDTFRGKRLLFWHTGGALGLFDKVSSLSTSLPSTSPCLRLDVYGKGRGVDIPEDE